MITAAQIKKFCPTAKAELVNAVTQKWQLAEDAGITTPLRIQHFMAEIATETGGLRSTEESLTYTSIDRIRAVWPSRFKSDASAKPFVRNPKALAIKVYGGRMGNAAAPSEDGWIYRGGGMMQTTGRDGYRKMGFESNPEKLRKPVIAFETAVREWVNRGCNALADKDDLVAIRKKINGGTNGLAEARAYLAKAKEAFTGEPVLIPAPGKKAEPKPAPKQDTVVRQVQDLLWDKGYPEVGESDNVFGRRTRNAILAFQADNGLPPNGEITDELLAQLVKAPKREQSSARENATAKDLKAEPVVKEANWLKKLGTGVLVSSGVGGLLNGTGNLDDAIGGISKVRSLMDTVLGLSPWVLLGVGGIAVFYVGRRIVAKHVEAYREGRAL